MKLETDIVLKYRRLNDAWVCSKCETENEINKEFCMLCGAHQTNSLKILKKWSIEEERYENALIMEEDRKEKSSKTFETAGTRPDTDKKIEYETHISDISSYTDYEEKSGSGGLIFMLLVIIVAIIVITAMVINGTI